MSVLLCVIMLLLQLRCGADRVVIPRHRPRRVVGLAVLLEREDAPHAVVREEVAQIVAYGAQADHDHVRIELLARSLNMVICICICMYVYLYIYIYICACK